MAAQAPRRIIFTALLGSAIAVCAVAYGFAGHTGVATAGPEPEPSLLSPGSLSPPDEPDDLSPPIATFEPGPTCERVLIPTPQGGFSPPDAVSGPYLVCLPATGSAVPERNPWAISIAFALGAGFLALIGAVALSVARDDRRS